MSTIIERERERRRKRRRVLRRGGLVEEAGRALERGWRERAESLLDHGRGAGLRALRARYAARPHDALGAVTGAAGELAASGDVGAALDALATAAALSLATGDGTAAEEMLAVLAALGADDDPRATAVRAVAGAPAEGREGEGWAGALTVLARGDAVRASDLLAAEAARLRRTGRLGLLVHVLGLRAEAARRAGDWAAVAEAATECRVLAERTGQPVWQGCATAAVALVEAVRGDGESSGRHAAEAEIVGGPLVAGAARFARGVALLGAERFREAYTVLLPLREGPRRAETVGHLAEAALRCGLRDAMPETRDMYARALLDGDEELFARARREARSPWAAARIDLEYGSWLRRQRRISESRLPLETARHTFEVLGAAPWARRAGREMRASSGAPAEGVLSAQELEIARFVADGLSNREIGQRMFLSPRTVGSHLYRIFPKLEVTSRAQLAGLIGEHLRAG
ncbi:hypothetical protein Ade02nite_59960 [Paractinoplanes deccanensis]|uniref:HTH luxR-type domain-containing protein n=1 Tax=Paractinoplanes deccanensis TaxID=113561 RepID=A0ABQ3YC45_9ACTN|nr:LuxR family transcriptional regulator [Actinoplanes deccanensis]GID77355.1 hypothetical protein Ade02nite_59960 [Actinoplanes deccanensis]